jgi:cephalosporin hydroxylase
MFNRQDLEDQKLASAISQSQDVELRRQALQFVVQSDKYGYAYQWTWLGLPIIQLPADIVAVQELIWQTQPDLIIETGVAWGGSLLLYASLMQLYGRGQVVGVDLNLYAHVAESIMSYPFSHRIHLYKGSSTDPDVFTRVKAHGESSDRVMVILDSNHTHEHVLEELRLYGPLVSKHQYLIVSDTIVEDIPVQEHRVRPWAPGRNPKSALVEYLRTSDRFEVDQYVDAKLLTSFNPMGYLKCIK